MGLVRLCRVFLVLVCFTGWCFASPPFSWISVAPSPIARTEAAGAAVGGRFYLFDGFINSSLKITNRVDVYNLASNTWTRTTDMPVGITHTVPAVDGQYVWFAGGFVGDDPGIVTNGVWKFDTISQAWSNGPSLPQARGGGVLVKVGRRVHFLGGYLPDRQTNSTNHWSLSLDGGTNWISEPALINARGHVSAAAVNGKIYMIGGQQGHDASTLDLNRVDVYDTVTKQWSTAANLPTPRSHCELSTFVWNDRIYLLAGKNGTAGQAALSSVLEFDPQANVWLALPSLPNPSVQSAAKIIGSKIVLAGGGINSSTAGTNVIVGSLEEKWETGTPLPQNIGEEIASGIISNILYLVSDSTTPTFALDLSSASWSTRANRPLFDNHPSGEVVNGKFYVIGGFNAAAGKVQIYDPVSNTWSLGSNCPVAVAAATSCVINGEIYYAGGIFNNSFTTNQHAKYNPANNTWTKLAPMPQGRNHAPGGTDGKRFFVFGGRGPGSGDNNVTANGFNTVQIYDPANNTWVSSLDAGSTIAPLPQARGGVWKAPYYNGEFFVMGGETVNGSNATPNHVYDRVDIYNVARNTWRLGATMITARHGIAPQIIGGRIYVAAGGPVSGYSQTNVCEIYNPTSWGSSPVNSFEIVNGVNWLRFPTISGRSYLVEQSTNLPVWSTITNNLSGNGGLIEINPAKTGSRQVFRTSILP